MAEAKADFRKDWAMDEYKSYQDWDRKFCAPLQGCIGLGAS